MNRRMNRLSEQRELRSILFRFASFLLIAAAGIWLAACSGAAAGEETPTISSPGAAPGAGIRPGILTAKDQGQGGITIKATWVVPGSPEAASVDLSQNLGFAISMDTHSGDINQYNLLKLSVLRGETGREIAPASWESISDGSHHRSGVIKFPRGAEAGSKYVELVIRDVGGAKERVLRWDLGQ